MPDAQVVYHFDLNTIDVEVLLEQDRQGSTKVFAALPVLLPGDWTVTWTLKAGNGIASPGFTGGIEIIEDTVPALLRIIPSLPLPGGPSLSRTVSFTNDCESSQEFKYNIVGEATIRETTQEEIFDFLKTPEKFHHDPTIAVVTDPIGG